MSDDFIQPLKPFCHREAFRVDVSKVNDTVLHISIEWDGQKHSWNYIRTKSAKTLLDMTVIRVSPLFVKRPKMNSCSIKKEHIFKNCYFSNF